MDNKIGFDLPLPEEAKWEAFGRGYDAVLMEKQHRIDRLEQMLFMLYDNICRDVNSTMLIDDDGPFDTLCIGILERVRQLKGDELTKHKQDKL